MRVSGEGKFGIIIGLVSIAGAGAIMLAPDRPWIGWGLIAISLIGLTVLIYHHFEERLGRSRTLAILLMIFGGMAFFGGAIWLGITNDRQSAANNPNSFSPLDRTVLLSCQWARIPDVIPANGFYEIPIYLGTGMLGGTITSSQRPGERIFRSDNTEEPSFAYMCKFINYGTAPVLNVEADLTLTIHAVTKVEDGTASGEIIETHVLTTPRTNLGIGDHAEFEFYVRNWSEYYAELILPPTARCQAVGSDQWQTVRLIPTESGRFALRPFVRRQPPS
jgi:hypothetical protein